VRLSSGVLLLVGVWLAGCAALGVGALRWFAGHDSWCPVREGLSEYGESGWSWWPLGPTCTYDTRQQRTYGLAPVDRTSRVVSVAVYGWLAACAVPVTVGAVGLVGKRRT
jgi:hypothetical protein